MNKIKILPIDLQYQKPTEINDCFIELFDKYLRYRMDFYADEPINNDDLGMGWENGVYNFYDIIALKDKISGMEKALTKDRKWGIYIQVSGFGNDIKCYFKKHSEANDVYDKIFNWLIE